MIDERESRPAGNEAAPIKLKATSYPHSIVRCHRRRYSLYSYVSVSPCKRLCLRHVQSEGAAA